MADRIRADRAVVAAASSQEAFGEEAFHSLVSEAVEAAAVVSEKEDVVHTTAAELHRMQARGRAGVRGRGGRGAGRGGRGAGRGGRGGRGGGRGGVYINLNYF